MNKFLLSLICMPLVLLTSCASYIDYVSYKGSISPTSYGLLEAKNGEERYEVLLRVHQTANEKGVMVDYRGIKTIDITIPKDAQPIPLGPFNDFAGVVFNVTNQSQNAFLFKRVNSYNSVKAAGIDIDGRDFRKNNKLNKGTKLLVIEDKNLWVENRKGYSYGHKRKDILLIKSGIAQNETVKPYNNEQSIPICRFYSVETPLFVLSNITLNRTPDCSAETYLCHIVGWDNVHFNNICVNTPPSEMTEDRIFYIIDCTNVEFKDVTINGTYSLERHSGYGICMNNIWNYRANKLTATGNWGIFGNNNINVATIENSEINRFDIHCYGRDISFKKVTFVKLYNQFSSVFGSIVFDNCLFDDFLPVLYEPSYDVQNNHNVVFSNCTFNMTEKRNSLLSIKAASKERSKRTELYDKCWPRISINQMTVNVPANVQEMVVVNTSKTNPETALDFVSDIQINGMNFNYLPGSKPINLKVSNIDVAAQRPVRISIDKLNILPKDMDVTDEAVLPYGQIIIGIKRESISTRSSIRESRVSNNTLFE